MQYLGVGLWLWMATLGCERRVHLMFYSLLFGFFLCWPLDVKIFILWLDNVFVYGAINIVSLCFNGFSCLWLASVRVWNFVPGLCLPSKYTTYTFCGVKTFTVFLCNYIRFYSWNGICQFSFFTGYFGKLNKDLSGNLFLVETGSSCHIKKNSLLHTKYCDPYSTKFWITIQ